jgi:hypothetical protein
VFGSVADIISYLVLSDKIALTVCDLISGNQITERVVAEQIERTLEAFCRPLTRLHLVPGHQLLAVGAKFAFSRLNLRNCLDYSTTHEQAVKIAVSFVGVHPLIAWVVGQDDIHTLLFVSVYCHLFFRFLFDLSVISLSSQYT